MYISLFFSVAIFSEHRPVQVVPQLNFCIEVFYPKCRICHCAYVCLSTGPRWPGGLIFLPKNIFTMDFCLFGAILNLKAFCFGAIPDIMIRVDILWECATKQAVMTVAQWHGNQIIRGPLVIGKKNV